ncbi:hypothetical protein ANO11243_040530 [Dothideomycetidae sp. 11243]|nr:hypothetical protein ANO11243_040530 [fungal sp. No.11243]
MDGHQNAPYKVSVKPLHYMLSPSEVGRTLPKREVDCDSIISAYVLFILFCNPWYNENNDTAKLTETFCSPPKNNKRAFHIFEIYLHFKAFYESGNKTWLQFALDLGVTSSTTEDGNASTQRVQQFLTRLKRWMKVTHVDAFFHYLIGIPNDYYLKVPPLRDPQPVEGRDGVLTGEDLAIRALDPELRPKRGRKRLHFAVEDLPLAQQHSLANINTTISHSLGVTPSSAFPRSAFPASASTEPQNRDPWSAIALRHPNSLSASTTEPHSAFPAFSTFSAHSGPVTSHNRTDDAHDGDEQRNDPPHPFNHSHEANRRQAQKLMLQVPEQKGGAVRLMTPVNPTKYLPISDSPNNGPAGSGSASPTPNLHNQLLIDLVKRLQTTPLRGRPNPLQNCEALPLAYRILESLGLRPNEAHNNRIRIAQIHLGLVDKWDDIFYDQRSTDEVEVSDAKLRVRRVIRSDSGRVLAYVESAADDPQDAVAEAFDFSYSVGRGNLSVRYAFDSIVVIPRVLPDGNTGKESRPVPAEEEAAVSGAERGREVRADSLADESATVVDWKARCEDLERTNRELRLAVQGIKSSLDSLARTL